VKQLDTDSTGSSSDTGSTSWDGKDAQKRNVVAGTYTITVESTKADGLVAASGTVVVR
jgi:flagellar hook assembly protein FlgD